MKAKVVNHYGHTVDSVPVTGVLNISDINCQALNDSMWYGINLSEDERLDEFKSHTASYISLEDYSDEVSNELSRLLDSINEINFDCLSEVAQNEILERYYDFSESYPDDTWLMGDWTKDENDQYKPDETGDYAAIVNESTIQVVWSKYIIRVKSLCSPCYPGQADISVDDEGDYLTSESGYLCYNLPDYFFDRDY